MACKICTHSERDNIDSALLLNTPLEVIASHYDIPVSDVKQHKERCVPFTMSMDEFDGMVKREMAAYASPDTQPLDHPDSLQRQINLREADYLTAVLQDYMITLKSTGREIQRCLKRANDSDIPAKNLLGQSLVDLYIGTGGEVRQTIKTLSDVGKQLRENDLMELTGTTGGPQIVIMGRS